ncbi:hypothetical protein LP52_02870 [Streptomonospora alba]|uniref:ANTAR domain-containing protein n=1 Tax=Streptomonospora alba TaxID=183763 RepID=A0A0C2GA62_9ACTN|nr:GAF and ANTAR domain-containing protein [Streptomonospora alba]KII00259.1 hypothetical protein LP52_02870 [Streptomonospora alba]
MPFNALADIPAVIARALGEADGCGLTLVHDDRTVPLSCTSATAAANDASQHAIGAGPCLEALETQVQVESRDLAAELRWGEYPRIAVDLGLRSVLAMPLRSGMGVLTLYSAKPDGFSQDGRRGAAEFAEIVGKTAEAAARVDAGSDTAQRLRTALRRSSDTEQAVGVLMARHGLGRAEAFDALLRTGRERGESVHAAVERVLDGSRRREP